MMASSKVQPRGRAAIELGVSDGRDHRAADPGTALRLREALIDVLGAIGDASTLPVLQAAAKDPGRLHRGRGEARRRADTGAQVARGEAEARCARRRREARGARTPIPDPESQ